VTTNALARRFRVDVDTGYPSAAAWTALTGITEVAPKIESTLQDADDYDSDGWGGSEKTMQKWSVEITVLRTNDNAGAFPAAQEALRAAQIGFGTDCRAHIRWYDRNGAAEAYEGYGIVQWERANSGVTDLDAAKITITAAAGSSSLTAITNPLAT
jgi:hypothetical protein